MRGRGGVLVETKYRSCRGMMKKIYYSRRRSDKLDLLEDKFSQLSHKIFFVGDTFLLAELCPWLKMSKHDDRFFP